MIMSQIEAITKKIDEEYKWLMQTKHTLHDIDIAFNSIKKFVRDLEQEPYVTMRDLSDEEIKHFAEEMKKVRVQVVEQRPCEDAVSRQAVLDMAEDMTDQFGNKHRVVTEGLISMLPPVTPTRKKGKWENLDSYHYYNDGEIETAELRCSCCNEIVEWDIESPHKPYYCENCGEEMESAEDGND